MKLPKSLLLSALLTTAALSHAQKPIVVSEDSVSFGASKYPGFVITIPEVDYELVQKNWIRELQTGTKSKVVNENNELSIVGALIKDISENPLSVYSKVQEQDSLVKMQVSIQLKMDQYIGGSPGDPLIITAKSYLKDFAKEQYVNLVEEEVKAEEKKLKDLKNELDGLKNNKSRMEKTIETSNNTIKTEGENIATQNLELPKLNAELENQNTQLASMEAGAAKDEKTSYIKDLDKRIKKMENDIKSSENKIKKAKSDIEEAQSSIPKNVKEQETVATSIAQQEAVVQKYTNKLNTVKGY
jgi:predicted  nucleic acid-binding Zn-ribbon protein